MLAQDLVRKVGVLNVSAEVVLDGKLAELVKAKTLFDIGAITDGNYREIRRDYLITLANYQLEKLPITHLYWFAFQKVMGAR